jgi:hypothetical protein
MPCGRNNNFLKVLSNYIRKLEKSNYDVFSTMPTWMEQHVG